MGGHPDDSDVHLVARNEALVVRAVFFLAIGIWRETKISPGASTLRPGAVQKSSTATWRLPFGPAMWHTAEWVIRLGIVSALGEALHKLPPKVARPCIWMPPIIGSRIDEPRVARDDFGVIVHAPAGHARANDQTPAGAVGKLIGLGDVLDVDDAVRRKALPRTGRSNRCRQQGRGRSRLFGLEGHGLAQRAGGAVCKIFQGKTSSLVSSDR